MNSVEQWANTPQGKELLDEVLLPLGLVIDLIVSCWAASQ
jgi:hypothetical protein